MQEIWRALVQAVNLIVSLDTEVVQISLRSLYISAASIIIAALFCVPIGSLIHFHDFRGKRVVINVIRPFTAFRPWWWAFSYSFLSRAQARWEDWSCSLHRPPS